MGEEGEVVKQNTIFCFFLPLLSFIFENLFPQLYFSKKKKWLQKKKKNLKDVCNQHLDKTIDGTAQEIAKLEFLSY